MTGKAQGYFLTLVAVTIFAIQDGISKYLGSHYSPIFIVMVRYWFFAAFVVLMAARGFGIVQTARTNRPFLQITRGFLLSAEIIIFVYGLSRAGMAMGQAIFQCTPLLVTMLSIPFLGEKVGWRRWTAIIIGLIGVLIIVNPIDVQFNSSLIFPLIATLMYALYSVATRAVGKVDSASTSFFYTGVAGVVLTTAVGIFHIEPVASHDIGWLIALCFCGMFSHGLLIKAYSILEAGEVQPLTYLQLVIGAMIATTVFGETLSWNLIIGAAIVVSAGLFSMFRERQLAKRQSPNVTPKPKPVIGKHDAMI